jgi:alpha-beta hydrolase superfamily lysophospholipase
MRKALLVLWCILMVCSAEAQTNNTVVKFVDFFKTDQPDSIYNLFAGKIKSALKVEGTRQFVTTIKSQLGEIVGFRESDTKVEGATVFILSFERPVVEMALTIKKDSIAGIFQKAVPPKALDSAEVNSPDNFSVDNEIGKLYGTLTLPTDKKRVPVVLLIGGSGPTDRNMNQGQALRTNSFLLLAKGLAENGIASLRYDKRGVGKSMGAVNALSLNLDDFINDAKLFVSKLASDDRFSEVIVLGHSEGAAIGLITCLQTKPAAFISLCGYKNNMVSLMSDQLKPILTPQDFILYTEIADSLKAGKIVHRTLPLALASIFTSTSQAFLISTLKYDSSTELAKLKIPVLVIGGSTDLQVPAEAATQLAKMNKRATLKIISEMNHVLKKAPSDRKSNLATYNNPNLPIHEDIIPILVNFIQKNSKL